MNRFGLPERLLAILVLMAAIDFGANAVLFDRASNFALRSDDAARIAENLTIASRALEAEAPARRPAMAERLSSAHLSLAWRAPGPRRRCPAARPAARPGARCRARTGLGRSALCAALAGLAGIGERRHAPVRRVGLVFHTQASEAWTLNVGRLAVFLLPTPLLALLAWVLFRATVRPLRALVAATSRVGAGAPEPLAESGPDEVRRLIRAFNRMQSRIHRQMVDRTQSMLAIGHDLRTPLARLRLRLDDAGIAPQDQADMVHDIDEMMHLLASLQAYVEGEGRQIPPSAWIWRPWR
jgi:HAMP domain-containing protein